MRAPAREFEKIIRGLAYRHHLWRVFSDFCEMTAISLGNILQQDPEQEKRYLEILSAYNTDEQHEFPKLLGLTTEGLEGLDCDFLGNMFMHLELSSHWHGQFFTPFSVAKMMAQVTLDGKLGAGIEEKGFVTLVEPACGAGGLCIAAASAIKESGFNYQTQIHMTCIDSDATAANMCFIQLALHHIPAAVYCGNTLSMEMQWVRHTPAHHLGFWRSKLERSKQEHPVPQAEQPRMETPRREDIILPGQSQFGLFDGFNVELPSSIFQKAQAA